MDFGSIAAAISSLKTTFDLVGGAIDSRDQTKLNELKVTLTQQLLEVSTTALLLQEKLVTKSKEHAELEEKINALTKQLEDSHRYKTHSFETGTIAFVDAQRQSDEPVAYFCAACMSEHKKTILQISRNKLFLSCPFGHPDIDISNESRSLMTLSARPSIDFSGY